MALKVTKEDFLIWIQKELQMEQTPNGTEAFREIPTWSSLNALVITTQILENWGVLISAEDLSNCVQLGDIWHLINTK